MPDQPVFCELCNKEPLVPPYYVDKIYVIQEGTGDVRYLGELIFCQKCGNKKARRLHAALGKRRKVKQLKPIKR